MPQTVPGAGVAPSYTWLRWVTQGFEYTGFTGKECRSDFTPKPVWLRVAGRKLVQI